MIVGLGHLNKDLIAVVPSWERDGKFEATQLFEQVGGPVPVALATLARLGIDGPPPALIATVGDDRHGGDLVRLLAEDGLQTDSLTRLASTSTSVSLVLVDARDGSRTLANYAGSIPPLTLSVAQETLLAQATLLHLDGRDLPASLRAAEIVRASGGLVSLDLGTMRPGVDALFPLCDIVIASQKGGTGAFPEAPTDPMAQTRCFFEHSVRQVAGVTLGARGVAIGAHGQEPVWLSAPNAEAVVDTNGAGDIFHGAFLWATLAGRDAVASAQFAQAAAGWRIGQRGNRAGMPRLADLEYSSEV